MADKEGLPQIDDLPRIDITGGMPAEVYVRMLRGDSEGAVEWLQEEVRRLRTIKADRKELKAQVDAVAAKLRALSMGSVFSMRDPHDAANLIETLWRALDQSWEQLLAAQGEIGRLSAAITVLVSGGDR